MTMSSIIFKTRKITFILFIVILFSAAFAFAQKPSFEVVPSSGPTIQNTTMPITSGAQGTKFTITTKVSDISGVASVIAHIQKPDETDVAVITLYDDGSHNDGAAGDGIYGNILDSTGKSAGVYFVDIIAKDRLGYSAQEENGASFSITSATTTTTTTTTTTIPSTTTTTIPSTTTTTTIPCIPTCSTGPGCSTVAITNAHTTADVCCGAGESCYDCNAGYSWDGANCVAACTDTCASLGYECGTQIVCGSPVDCGSCTLPATCNILGKCVTVSTLSTTITMPENNTEYTQGDWVSFNGIVLGGVPDYTWEWSSDKDGVFSSSQAGSTNTLSVNTHTITLKITDGNGDTATDSISITVKPADTLATQINMWRTEFANGEIIWFGTNVSGGTAPYSFVWNSNHEGDFATEQWPSVDTGATPWTLGTHTITVTATDSLGATATDTIDIDIVEMTVDIIPRDGDHFIFSDSVWFNAHVLGGTMPYSYSWVSDLDGEIGTTDWFNRDDLQQGMHTITVNITDSSATPITIIKTFRIQIDPPPLLTITIDNPPDNSTFNQGDDISFEGTYTGGVWPLTFTWTSNIDGNIYTHNVDPDFSKNNLSVGTHTITLTVTDNSGQTATDTITVIINPSIPLTATINSPNNGDVFLRMDDVINFDGSASGGVSPYTYQWFSNQDGDITPTENPKNKFSKNDLSVNSHTITLTVTDSVGATSTDSVNITVNANCSFNNVKNNTKYTAQETFLIADTNWRDVLSLVPIAIWNDSGTIHKYPALIYHYESNTKFDADSTIHFMQMYDPSHLTTIGNIPGGLNNLFTAAEPVGAGMNIGDISNIQSSDYFSYWSTIGSLVVVDYDNYKAGLMASVFASHKNSPIIFVNSANLATYQAMINGKVIYTVGSLDGATQGYISANAGCEVNYTLEEVQKWYATETNSDKLILVNPNDLNIEGTVFSINTEKNGTVSKLFSKMSLSSPFLASVKKEVISYTELSDPGLNDKCSSNAVITGNISQADSDAANAISNLFSNTPEYFTVIAAPPAIPDSEYDRCPGAGIWQMRMAADWKYGSLGDLHLKTGRIYGVSSADSSTYVNEVIFFDKLISSLYGGNFTGVSIGHSFDSDETNAQLIKQKTSSSGYNSSCFVGSAGYPDCIQDASPPTSVYQNMRFITFADHGSPGGWCGTLEWNQIPWLDLPYSIGHACLTNNYWQGFSSAFGANMIRKGAIGYLGSAGVTFLGSLYCPGEIKRLTGDDHNTVTLGFLPPLGSLRQLHYIFLGDPTLQLKLKQVNWD